jgi:hypothetical protein
MTLIKRRKFPLHERLAARIEIYGISKSKIAKAIGISRPTLDVYLRDGMIGNVGGHGEKHDLTTAQKKIIRDNYLK